LTGSGRKIKYRNIRNFSQVDFTGEGGAGSIHQIQNAYFEALPLPSGRE